jgi:acetyl/propionyl-CoA carboxylase alpha subunit
MEFEFLVEGALKKVALEKTDAGFVVREDGAILEADIRPVADGTLLIIAGGRSHLVRFARSGDRMIVALDGREFSLERPSAQASRFGRADDKGQEGERQVRTPMPGKVIKICVSPGDEVRKNQVLVIVEAMKMENELAAGTPGVVKAVFAAVGELVDPQKVLVEIEPKET